MKNLTLIFAILVAVSTSATAGQQVACGQYLPLKTRVQSDRITANGFAMTYRMYGRDYCGRQLERNLEAERKSYPSSSALLESQTFDKLNKKLEPFRKSC